MKFLVPPPLAKGSHVAVINTGRVCDADLGPQLQLLEEKQFVVHRGKSLTSAGSGQFACDDAVRLGDLQWAIDEPAVQAVFFVRGGYGMLRVLDRIDFSALYDCPKWLVGYSDITYLLGAVQKNPGMACVHSPMVSAWGQTPAAHLDALFGLLSHRTTRYTWQGIRSSKPFQKIQGSITGGNLTILHSMAAMGTLPSAAGKILFLEDIFENLMSIERMLYALKHAGLFDDIQALVLGDVVVPVKDNETSNHLYPGFAVHDEATAHAATEHLFSMFFAGASFPVIRFVPVGHASKRNHPLVFGVPVGLSMHGDVLEMEFFA